jgi:hypothetical protein
MLDHNEMVLLRAAAYQLRTMEHVLCSAQRLCDIGALFDVQRRALFWRASNMVYASPAKNANSEEMIVAVSRCQKLMIIFCVALSSLSRVCDETMARANGKDCKHRP